MRRVLYLLAAAAAIVSCSRPLFDTMPRWYTDGPRSRTRPVTEEVDSSALDLPPRKGVYVTAIRFPEWAKWQDGDFRGAEAVLFRDSVEIAKAPVGPLPDADRVRLWNGHLWTDIADEGQTRIFRDGVEQFSYPEEELLRGFLIEEGNVHTLGQRPGSRGITYRINGEPVFSTKSGAALGAPSDREWDGGALMRDSSGVYFVYGIPFRQGSTVTTEYHVMRGADEVMSIPANHSGAIYDIRVWEGKVYRSERRNQSSQSLCLVLEDMYLALDIGPEEEVHMCKLIPMDGEIMVKGYSETTRQNFFWIRSRSGIKHASAEPGIQDLYVWNNIHALIAIQDGLVSKIFKNYSYFTVMPSKYKLMGSRCADFKDNFFAIALSNPDSPDHLLILDGQHVPMHFNGYFTSLKII